ncbi:hypothetical protein BASA61_004849 [Batrachochytrium salamandrivorans]|nr:hypothetical protein BASA61_004849 [Batrachochytrium salamandrivorans]
MALALDALEALVAASLGSTRQDNPLLYPAGTTACNLLLLRLPENNTHLHDAPSVLGSTALPQKLLTPLTANPLALKHVLNTTLDTITAKLQMALDVLQESSTLPLSPSSSTASISIHPSTSIPSALERQSFALEALLPIQHSINACIRSAAGHCTAGNSRLILERSIELATQELGIQFYATEPLNCDSPATVTLCGSIFVVDIEFGSDASVSKVHLTSATNVNLTNSQAESLIMGQLRLRHLAAFKKTLALLSFLDTASIQSKVDLFQCMSWIEKDLTDLFSMEMNLSSQSLKTVLVSGHGVPRFHHEQWGPSILYWCHPNNEQALQDPIAASNDPKISSDIYKAFVSMDHSNETRFLSPSCTQYMVPSDTIDFNSLSSSQSETLLGTKVRFLDPVMEGSVSAPVSFVLELAPHVLVTLATARLLNAMQKTTPAGIDIDMEPSLLTADSGDLFSSYDDLLFEGLFTPGESAQSVHVIKPAAPPPHPSETTAMDLSIPDRRPLVFTFPTTTTTTATTAMTLPLSATLALRISRVPFTSPVQLHSILTLLRREIVFQTIAQSVFNRDGQVTSRPNGLCCTVDRVHWSPPSSLGVAFMHSFAPYMFQLRVEIDPVTACAVVSCYTGAAGQLGGAVVWSLLDLGAASLGGIQSVMADTLDLPGAVDAFILVLDQLSSK